LQLPSALLTAPHTYRGSVRAPFASARRLLGLAAGRPRNSSASLMASHTERLCLDERGTVAGLKAVARLIEALRALRRWHLAIVDGFARSRANSERKVRDRSGLASIATGPSPGLDEAPASSQDCHDRTPNVSSKNSRPLDQRARFELTLPSRAHPGWILEILPVFASGPGLSGQVRLANRCP
jgi:hypothetical protein